MKPLILTLLLCVARYAAANSDLNFHGFLVNPPICVISNNETIEIPFSSMQIDDVNGSNYSQVIPYTVDCDSELHDAYMTMTLTLIGTPSDFDDAAISTDAGGLAIKVLHDDKPFTLGSTIIVDRLALPILKAVPIKKEGITLAEGDFEAWATLQVEYQ